jgi:hypothetical protein
MKINNENFITFLRDFKINKEKINKTYKNRVRTKHKSSKNKMIKNKCKSKEVLNYLLKLIENAEQHYTKCILTTSDTFVKSNDFEHMPDEIKTEIENMKCSQYICNFSIEKDNHMDPDKYSVILQTYETDIEVLQNYVKKIYIWLYIANSFSRHECSHNLEIYLYLTKLKKQLPEDGFIIEEKHANTAFTMSCKKHNEINIFRQEEWFKVLIHESFHAFGLDFSELDNTPYDGSSEIIKLFPLASDVNLFETYCEMWAEIFNILFIVYFNSKNINMNFQKNKAKIMMEIENRIQNERLFSLFQCAKVLNHYSLEYKELYERSLEAENERNTKYKERTNVLSYYIIKSIFMFFINDFLIWCCNNNKTKKGLFTLQMKQTPENIKNYCKFIENHYKDPKYTGSLFLFEDWFRNANNASRIIPELYNTLRMTITTE